MTLQNVGDQFKTSTVVKLESEPRSQIKVLCINLNTIPQHLVCYGIITELINGKAENA